MIFKRTFEECVSLFSYQCSSLSQTALIEYHAVFRLSRTFFNFFRGLFQVLNYLSDAALVLYHHFLYLSISFFKISQHPHTEVSIIISDCKPSDNNFFAVSYWKVFVSSFHPFNDPVGEFLSRLNIRDFKKCIIMLFPDVLSCHGLTDEFNFNNIFISNALFILSNQFRKGLRKI